MSKLQEAIGDLLQEVREGNTKTASVEVVEKTQVTSHEGKMLSKLASAVREVSLEPTYSDLENFLRGVR